MLRVAWNGQLLAHGRQLEVSALAASRPRGHHGCHEALGPAHTKLVGRLTISRGLRYVNGTHTRPGCFTSGVANQVGFGVYSQDWLVDVSLLP